MAKSQNGKISKPQNPKTPKPHKDKFRNFKIYVRFYEIKALIEKIKSNGLGQYKRETSKYKVIN